MLKDILAYMMTMITVNCFQYRILSAKFLQIGKIVFTEACLAYVLIVQKEKEHVVAGFAGHVVQILIGTDDLEDQIVLEHGSGVVENIVGLVHVQITENHMIIVLRRHVLIFHVVIVGVGYGHKSVKHLYDEQSGKKAGILLKIEKHTLEGDLQASCEILKQCFQCSCNRCISSVLLPTVFAHAGRKQQGIFYIIP